MAQQLGSVPIPFNGPLSADAAATLRPGTLFESAQRAAAAYTTQEFANLAHAGAQFVIDITDRGAAGTLTVKVQVFNPGTNAWVDLTDATTTALAAVASTLLTIHPGITHTANAKVSAALPARWRLVATVGTEAVTFSVAGFYIP